MKAFMYGCLIGGALGICYAPRKGDETRKMLADWWEGFQGQAQPILQTAQSNMQAIQSNLQSMTGGSGS